MVVSSSPAWAGSGGARAARMADGLGEPVGTVDQDPACCGLLPRAIGTTGRSSNEDINSVVDRLERDSDAIPDHDLLVGGFPCQDYSVAKTLNQAHGIEGKKGVLWWAIYRIIEAKQPKLVFLENVDRLLKSPASQRGRDFAIILACLSDLGYLVEWRVVNAAHYGFPQRRRRVFIVARRIVGAKPSGAARLALRKRRIGTSASGLAGRGCPTEPACPSSGRRAERASRADHAGVRLDECGDTVPHRGRDVGPQGLDPRRRADVRREAADPRRCARPRRGSARRVLHPRWSGRAWAVPQRPETRGTNRGERTPILLFRGWHRVPRSDSMSLRERSSQERAVPPRRASSMSFDVERRQASTTDARRARASERVRGRVDRRHA